MGARIEGEDTTVFYWNLFMSVWTLPKLEDELTCLCHAQHILPRFYIYIYMCVCV